MEKLDPEKVFRAKGKAGHVALQSPKISLTEGYIGPFKSYIHRLFGRRFLLPRAEVATWGITIALHVAFLGNKRNNKKQTNHSQIYVL